MFFKLLPYIGIIAFAVGLFFAGQMRGSLQCQLSTAKAVNMEVKTSEKIQQKILALPDADLNKRLSKWLRD